MRNMDCVCVYVCVCALASVCVRVMCARANVCVGLCDRPCLCLRSLRVCC